MEEILVFMALTGGPDFGVNKNLANPVINGRKHYVMFDMPSTARWPTEELSGFSYQGALLASGWQVLNAARFDRAIHRAQSISRDRIVELVHISGIVQEAVPERVAAIIKRQANLRDITMQALMRSVENDWHFMGEARLEVPHIRQRVEQIVGQLSSVNKPSAAPEQAKRIGKDMLLALIPIVIPAALVWGALGVRSDLGQAYQNKFLRAAA